jgi:pimeloyl-ACP methyl ester carboxylesterase
MICDHVKMSTRCSQVVLALALVFLAGCATTRAPEPELLRRQVAVVDRAYSNLRPGDMHAYNAALAPVVRRMEHETPADYQAQLAAAGVQVDKPAIKLPLARYAPVHRQRKLSADSIGIPVLLDFNTKHSPVYPEDGLFVPATAVYRRINGKAHLSLITGQNSIDLGGHTFPLTLDHDSFKVAFNKRAKRIARTGFRHMLRPVHPQVRTQIYLVEPYDPNKIPVLMVHGLQSTPVAFLKLFNAMRLDPELSARFQVWTFLYGTGTPVLFNALSLRQELEKTLHALDPHDRDFATRNIVVVGHSMGGLIAHTLVSSSGDEIWEALFLVPPDQLKGEKELSRLVEDAMRFQRNPRVVRAIFIATPHRGSRMADSWIGRMATRLIRLPPVLQTGLPRGVRENASVMTPQGRAFSGEMNITSVRTLSPRDPGLLALARLPIQVPFHSIMGQRHPGPKETGSDGVVTYASAHLDGAASELVVRSNHQLADNPEAQAEVGRILRLELRKKRKRD